MIAMVSFVLGRIFAQSEAVLAEKRRVYEEFLKICPQPNDVYLEWNIQLEQERFGSMRVMQGPFLLYAAPSVQFAMSRYMLLFDEVDQELGPDTPPLHPRYKELAKAQNDLILEMSRDALGWSVFGFKGKSRLPADALEQAKRNTL